MTAEEYKKEFTDYAKKISELEERAREIKKLQMALSEKYIEEHREFQNGDLVKITQGFERKINGYSPKAETAFIDSAFENKGKIHYRFVQVKKDGTSSLRRLQVSYYLGVIKIELINTDNRNKNFNKTPTEEKTS